MQMAELALTINRSLQMGEIRQVFPSRGCQRTVTERKDLYSNTNIHTHVGAIPSPRVGGVG